MPNSHIIVFAVAENGSYFIEYFYIKNIFIKSKKIVDKSLVDLV